MKKMSILLVKINNNFTAMPVTKEVIEAAIFWAIRAGAKKMMIVHAETYQLLAGEDAHKAAVDRGDTEAEVLMCDSASPAITQLAELNADSTKAALKSGKQYDY